MVLASKGFVLEKSVLGLEFFISLGLGLEHYVHDSNFGKNKQ